MDRFCAGVALRGHLDTHRDWACCSEFPGRASQEAPEALVVEEKKIYLEDSREDEEE
jgi:hypothetical protein